MLKILFCDIFDFCLIYCSNILTCRCEVLVKFPPPLPCVDWLVDISCDKHSKIQEGRNWDPPLLCIDWALELSVSVLSGEGVLRLYTGRRVNDNNSDALLYAFSIDKWEHVGPKQPYHWFQQPLNLKPLPVMQCVRCYLSDSGQFCSQSILSISCPHEVWHLNLLPLKSSAGVVCPGFAPTQYCELDCGWKWQWLTPVTYRPVVPSTFQPLVVFFLPWFEGLVGIESLIAATPAGWL